MKNLPGPLRRLSIPALRSQSVAVLCLFVALGVVADAATTRLLAGRLVAMRGVFSAAEPPPVVSWREAGGRTTVQAAERGAPWIRLRDGVEVRTEYAGEGALAGALKDGETRALALASGDFDEDGVPDLVAAHAGPSGGLVALHRGNVDAIYPNAPEAQARKASGTFTDAPFLAEAAVFAAPAAPDFAGAGDFDADGHLDVVVGARGGEALYLLAGDGDGALAPARLVALPGRLTALAVGEVNRRDGMADVVAAVRTDAGASLLVFEHPRGALANEPETIALPAEATEVAVGDLAGKGFGDVATAAGRRLVLVHGRDRLPALRAASPAAVDPAEVETRSFQRAISSLAAGDFAGDARRDLAVLTEDGALRTFSAPAGDAPKRLREWEAGALAAKMAVEGGRLVKATVSSRHGDDLVVVDAAASRLHLVEGGDRATAEGAPPAELDVDGVPAAVLPMRLNRDGLSDLVVLGSSSKAPTVVETTFFTVQVTTVDDNAPGSLREAMGAAGEVAGADVIEFNIAPAGPKSLQFNSPLPGIGEAVTIDATTQPGFMGQPIVFLDGTGLMSGSGLVVQMPASGVVIRGLVVGNFPDDGIRIFSETSSTTIEGNYIGVHPNGIQEAGNGSDGVEIGFSPNNVVGGTVFAARNLIGGNADNGVTIAGSSDNVVRGNAIGLNDGGTGSIGNGLNGVEITSGAFGAVIGGAAAGAGNVISGNDAGGALSNGVYIHGESANTLVQGNVVGLTPAGSFLGNGANGILEQTGGSIIGGAVAGAGNVISGNAAAGVRIENTFGTALFGNIIGLDATAQFQRSNTTDGVVVSASNGIDVGGSMPGAGNVISRNQLYGVRVTGSSSFVSVTGNFVGTGLTVTEVVGNLQGGVLVEGASAPVDVTGNAIQNNIGPGVAVSADSNLVAIVANTLFNNNGIGVDLGEDGVTANDAGDADSGPNGLLNFPVITSAVLDGGVTTVEGTLDAEASTDYRVELFVNIGCDPSGNGEGQFVAGTVDVTTDESGNALFSTALTYPANPGNLVTATASELGTFAKGPGAKEELRKGSIFPILTSELSACFPVGSPPVVQADLAVTASDSPDPALPGQDVTYTVTLTNNGPETATKVSLSAFTPAGTTFQSAAAPPGWNVFAPPVGGTGEVLLALGTFNSGDSAIFTIVVNVDPDTPGDSSIDFSATATADQEDPDPDNSTVMESTFVEPQSDVAVTNEAASPQVLAGQEITYTITATNDGPDPAFFVRVEDTTPPNTTFVSATVPAGWSLEDAPAVGATGTVSWTRSPVASGEMATFTLVVRVDDGTPGGTLIQNFASANGEFSDPNLGDNSAPADVTVTPQVDVAVTQTDAPDPVTPGQNITYTVSVAFNGPDPAGFATYTGATPANTTFQSVSLPPNWSVDQAPEIGGTGTIALVREGGQGKAAKGMVLEQITVVVQVDPGTPGGTMITNMVSVAPEGFDPNSADNTSVETTAVQSVSDLSITAMVSPDPVLAGNDLTFTLEVTNNGPDDAFGLTLTDAVPANTTFKSISVPPFWTPAAPFPGNTGPISAITGGLPNGETATITYVVTVNPGTPAFTEISNNATIFVDPDVDPNAANDTASASAFVASTVDLSVSQTDSPDPALAGQDVTYTITVTNNGPDFPLSLSLDGAVPANTTFQSLTTPPGWDAMTPPVGGTGPYSASIFTSKQPKAQKKGLGGVFTLVVRVNPGTAGGTIVTNSVSVASPQFDPNGANNMSSETTTVDAQADVALTAGAAPDPVLAGQDVTFTIQVTNNGPDDAVGLTLTDAVPANTTFQSISVPPGWTPATPMPGGTGSISAITGGLGAGASATISYVVRVNPGTAGGTSISNGASVVADTADPNAANNMASASATVASQADVAVSVADSPDPVLAGQDVTYTVTVTNNGPDTATSVTFSTAVPAGTALQSIALPPGSSCEGPPIGGSGPVSCSIADLAPGASRQIGFVTRVAPGTPGGTVINVPASASALELDPTPANNNANETTTVAAQADLAVTKGAAPDPVLAGADVTYTIQVTNNGPDSASATVADAVPANTTFQSISAPPGWSTVAPAVGGTGPISVLTPTLASGASGTITLVVRVNPGTPGGTAISNTTTVSTGVFDPSSANDSASATVFVEPQVDLAVSQTDAPDPVVAGQEIAYTISLANNGPDSPSSAVVSGTIPANTTFQSFEAPAGWNVAMPPVGGTGAYSASISFKGGGARGAAGVFTLVVRVDPGMLGGATISHTVGASSPELDPVPANNSSTEMTSVTALADLAVTKGAAPGSVLAGQDVTYTIQVTNNGPDAAAGVSLAEAVPANTTFQSLATPAGWTSMTPPVGGTGPITSTTPSLAPGATAVFTLVVRVDAGAPGGTIVANTSTAASATGDPNVANNSASANVFVDSTVDMAVSQAGSPEPATPGETIAYTITVANNGPDLPSAISLNGSIPANTTFESLAAPAGWSVATPPVGGTGAYSASISFEGEPARGADVFTLVVRVDDAAPNAAVISHTVSVSSPEFDPNSANNTSTETTAVLALMADVSVTKSATPEVVLAGQEITYTIAVRNDGPDAAASVTLDDAVPANTAFQSLATPAGWTSATPPVGGAGTVTSTTPSLASGATAVFTLVVRVDDLALAGSVVSNTATALSAETLDPNGANNSATTTTAVGAVPSADVSLVKSGTPSTVSPGSAITYTLVATNNGPNDATDLTISDPTPTDTTFVSAMASTGGVLTTPAAGAAGTVRATWPGVTPAGTTRTATIVVEVDSDTPTNTVITNLATATSGALDANAGNNLATQATNVVVDESIPVADLSITVDGLPGIVDTGTFLDYTIRVSNAGPDEAADVRVSGSTPDGTRFVSLTGDGATFATPAVGGVGNFEAYFERIGPGETATLHLVLNVVAEGGATISTSIGLSSGTDDPTASNNATSTATRVQAGNDVLLTWDPPLECEDDCLNPPLHLQSSTVDDSGSRAAGGPGFTGHVRKLFKRNTVTGYNVYRSNMPNVQATPANFFTSVPPNQTQVVAPTAPGGSFFTVTATYPNGESGGTNAASGGLPEPEITGIVTKGKKVLVVGEGFSDTVQVFVDGIPFVKGAKVKQAKGRVQQKGKLLTGQTVQEYIRQQGGVVLISVLNEDTGIGTFLYRP